MKRYQFPLQQLLDLREYKKTEAEAELARHAGIVALLNTKLEENAKAAIYASKERFRPGGDALDAIAAENYSIRIASEREKLLEELAKAEMEKEDARLVYIKARVAKEVVGKLRERDEKQYYKDIAREEEKTMDDLASNSWRKNHLDKRL